MPTHRPPHSAIDRTLGPLVALLWPLFFVWTTLVAAVWATGFGHYQLERGIANPGLQSALSMGLNSMDAIWLTLAAINAYLALCATDGLAAARRWTGLTLGAAFIIGLTSALTRWPLGPISFPENLGPKLGPVPLGLPLLWFVVVSGGRDLAMRWFSKASHLSIAGIAGAFAMITDLNLEPVVWKWRAWWLWYPADFSAPFFPPLQNFLTWLFAGAAIAFVMRPANVVPRSGARRGHAAIILISINAVCVLAHTVHFFRR